jgi:hypothetical protein
MTYTRQVGHTQQIYRSRWSYYRIRMLAWWRYGWSARWRWR